MSPQILGLDLDLLHFIPIACVDLRKYVLMKCLVVSISGDSLHGRD